MKNLIILITILGSQLLNLQQSEKELAESFIANLQAKKFEQAVGFFDDNVKSKIDESQLSAIWNSINLQAGSFKEIIEISVDEKTSGVNTVSLCKFQNAYLNIRLSFNSERKISGIFFQPAQAPAKLVYELPLYSNNDTFEEVDTEIKNKIGLLKAIYTKPRDKENPPVVVFVHGSGPQDADGTVGPNKIFKDISTGLATNGIASIRYVKRTKAFPESFTNSFTVEEEVIEDALLAVVKASDFSNGPVFLAGHSLGGMLAPLIASKTDRLTGVILLAGNNRPLAELMIEQIDYLTKNNSSDENTEAYNNLKKGAERVRNGDYDLNTSANELAGIPPVYWRNLQAYDPLKTASKVRLPFLVLQGERDYQVTLVDFENWKKPLGKRVKAISYPKLNHMFYEGEGILLPKEYTIRCFVSELVIKDMTKWIIINKNK